MSYITVIGACDSLDDASYEREVDQADGSTARETVHQTQVTLSIPGCREVVKATFGDQAKINPAWEENMEMLKVTCDKFTVSTGVRKSKAWAVVGFHGVTIEKASNSEIDQVNKERKAAKAIAKQKRAEAKLAKAAAASGL